MRPPPLQLYLANIQGVTYIKSIIDFKIIPEFKEILTLIQMAYTGQILI